LPRLVELNEKYKDMGVRFISIDAGKRDPAGATFLEENNVRHLVLNDPAEKVMGEYRVFAIPVTIMVDQEGRAVFRHIGFSDEMLPRFKSEIEALIKWRDAASA
jgi:thiol-disulfide isomerase/thioredoxin